VGLALAAASKICPRFFLPNPSTSHFRSPSIQPPSRKLQDQIESPNANKQKKFTYDNRKMAQGTLKSKKLTTATAKTSRKPTVLGPKKGARTIAPRKQVLVRNKGMVKVVTPFLSPSDHIC
jgi:hypothetical protein